MNERSTEKLVEKLLRKEEITQAVQIAIGKIADVMTLILNDEDFIKEIKKLSKENNNE